METQTKKRIAHLPKFSSVIFILLFVSTLNYAKACTASFSSVISSCNISFTSTSTGVGSLTYAWDFGDGNTSSVANPSHNYSHDGPYTIELTVTDSLGCISQFDTTVLIIGCFPAGYGYFLTSSNFCVVNFNDMSVAGGGASYFWDFGDGDTSHIQSPTHTYAISGTYFVCLNIIDHANVCNYTYCDSITVNCNNEPSGIDDLVNHNQSILVYPNPSSGFFYIVPQNGIDIDNPELMVFNSLGENVKTTNSKSQQWLIDISDLQAGIYYCRLVSKGHIIAMVKIINK